MGDVFGSDVEGREEAEGFGAGGNDEEAFVDEVCGDRDGGWFTFGDLQGIELESDSEKEAVASDFGYGGVVPACDFFTDLGFPRFNVGNEVFGQDGFDDGFGGGAGEGVAAVGGAMATGAEEAGVLLSDPEGADGEAAAHAFGPRDGVGLESRGDGIVAVEVACSSEAALDFIEKEEEVVFLSEGGEAFQELLRGDVDSAFALDGFDEEGDGFVVEGRFDGLEIIEIDVFEAGEERIKAIVDLGLRGGGHGSNGPPVEGLVEGDDFVSSGGLAKSSCEFDEPVIGFGSRVGEEDFAGLLDDFFHDELGKVGLGDDVVEVGAVHQGGGLLRDGGGQSGVAMSE